MNSLKITNNDCTCDDPIDTVIFEILNDMTCFVRKFLVKIFMKKKIGHLDLFWSRTNRTAKSIHMILLKVIIRYVAYETDEDKDYL